MQFFITLDTTKPGNFERFARLMKELQCDWRAPYHAGAELDIEIDNDLHYCEMLQEMIQNNDPLLEVIPNDHIEQQKEVLEQEDEDTKQAASTFYEELQKHNISIVSVAHGNSGIDLEIKGDPSKIDVYVPYFTMNVGVLANGNSHITLERYHITDSMFKAWKARLLELVSV